MKKLFIFYLLVLISKIDLNQSINSRELDTVYNIF